MNEKHAVNNQLACINRISWSVSSGRSILLSVIIICPPKILIGASLVSLFAPICRCCLYCTDNCIYMFVTCLLTFCLSQNYPIKYVSICIVELFTGVYVCVCCKMENESLTQFVLDGFQDAVWVAQHAGCCRADLNEVFSHGLTQEHGVKCRYFIHSHWRNFQHLSDLKENTA